MLHHLGWEKAIFVGKGYVFYQGNFPGFTNFTKGCRIREYTLEFTTLESVTF